MASAGKNVAELLTPPSGQIFADRVENQIRALSDAQDPVPERFSVEGHHLSGRVVPLEVTLQGHSSLDEPRVLALFRDLTHREQMSDTVRAAAESYSALSETTTDAIVQINEDLQIIYANSAAQAIFRLETEEVSQQEFSVLFPAGVYNRYRDHFRKYFLIDDAHRKESQLENVMEVLGRRNDSEVFPLEISFGNSRNVLGERILTCIMRDITERKRTERQLKFLAYHDKLTELGNRDLLYESLKQYLAQIHRSEGTLGALLFLDLDGFKKVNDTLGHEAGDQILREAAKRVSGCLRESDLVYRYSEEMESDQTAHEELFRFGGDEFVILLTKIGNRTDAGTIAQRILLSVSRPYDVMAASSSLRSNLGVSIGIALIPENGTDAMTLIHSADVAMYKAKESRNSFIFFNNEINRQANQRIELESGLRQAVENDGFVIHYQPLVDAEGNMKGAEALLRWTDPRIGSIPPSEFIPVAEETGLIIPIGDWVLRSACEQLLVWNKSGPPDFYVSVNLSVKQFGQPDLVERLTQTIKESGIDAANLKIEITESCLMKDPDETRRRMTEIKERNPGIRIAIDDFGAGYSSLSYLSELPVDTLKIDQSFVMNLYTSRHNPKIVNTILALAYSLHLDVIAEGVETEAQLHYLSTKECGLFQGYYFAKPMPANEIEDRLRAPQQT